LKSQLYPFAGLALTLAAGAASLRCSNEITNNGSQFVGIWSCPASLAAVSSSLVITENLDDSLTLASDTDAGGLFCQTDSWNYTSSTASMNSGTSCTGGATGAEVITVKSFTLSLSGNKLDLSVDETVSSQAEEADGGFSGPAINSTINVSGACTKE
jgi:hypothetical protein